MEMVGLQVPLGGFRGKTTDLGIKPWRWVGFQVPLGGFRGKTLGGFRGSKTINNNSDLCLSC
jgi:hypothetical protein